MPLLVTHCEAEEIPNSEVKGIPLPRPSTHTIIVTIIIIVIVVIVVVIIHCPDMIAIPHHRCGG